MAYTMKRKDLPTRHPFYLENSDQTVNALCKTSADLSSYKANGYTDKFGNNYLKNPLATFLLGCSNFQQNGSNLLCTGFGLGLECDLFSKSFGSESMNQNLSGEISVTRDSLYGYNLSYDGSSIATQIAPIIFFELVGGGGGGGSTYSWASSIAGGGGGGGGTIRGLIDLSQITTIYFKVGIGGKGGSEASGTEGVGSNGSLGQGSWISTESTRRYIYASGGLSGSYTGTSGAGGTCKSIVEQGSPLPQPTAGSKPQPGLYIIDTSEGGNGGKGANGSIPTVGKGASINAYTLAGYSIIASSSMPDSSLIIKYDNNYTYDSSQDIWFTGGSGGSSARALGGTAGSGFATDNHGNGPRDKSAGNGLFPGGGGGGGGPVSSYEANINGNGGNGANGRLLLYFAKVPAMNG